MQILTLLSVASILPTLVLSMSIPKNKGMDVKKVHECDTDSKGAIYFMTNEPTGNYVVSACIGPDGGLTLAGAIYALGHGGRGKATGIDPLFSQGPVVVSQQAGYLAAVNPGSNSVELFKIDTNAPSVLNWFGNYVWTGGEFPVSAAFNNDGSVLCVLNGGKVSNVRCFCINDDSGLAGGSIRSVPLTNSSFPPAGPLHTASTINFTPDGMTVVAAIKGTGPGNSTVPAFLASWSLLSRGCAELSETTTITPVPDAVGAPFSLTPVPGQKAFLSADFGVDVFDYSRGFDTSELVTKTLNIKGQKAVCWSAYSDVSENFYVMDAASGQVTEIAVGYGLTPSVVQQYTTPGNTGADEGATITIGDKGYMYILLPAAKSIGIMQINGPGNATFMPSVDLSGFARDIEIPISADQLAGMAVYSKC